MSNDSWRTPDWLFKKLEAEHGPFDIDLCATAENTKTDWYGINYLENFYGVSKACEITGAYGTLYQFGFIKTAFMNPPYSNPLPFIKKAWEDSKHCKIVCLLKVDTSTKWWSVFWDYDIKCNYLQCSGKGTIQCYEGDETCPKCNGTGIYNGPKFGCSVYFIKKRVQFDPPIGYTGKTSSSSFPSCVVVMDRRFI